MWFRRKKKTDPDSALSDTLRSLQTLLEDKDSVENEQRVAPKMEPNVGRFDPPVEQSDTASIPALHADAELLVLGWGSTYGVIRHGKHSRPAFSEGKFGHIETATIQHRHPSTQKRNRECKSSAT